MRLVDAVLGRTLFFLRALRALRVNQKVIAMAVAAIGFSAPLHAEPVQFDSFDGTPLKAHWLPAPIASDRAPVVVALHGCGGLYQRDGKTLDARYPEYAARLHAQGIHVLLPDSFTSRGTRQICTTANAERSITVETRRNDVLAALRWVASQPGVDAGRIVLLGWSHGAMTALTTINAARTPSAQPLVAVVTFYPGCSALLKREFRLDVPLLMLLGAEDDWTPPAGCIKLVEQLKLVQPLADVTLRVYPDSSHGFDSTRPVRFRTDVPNGVNKAGVHQGGNPQARATALAEFDQFLVRVLRLGQDGRAAAAPALQTN
jgi:dienelactone hydrolase